MRPRYQKEECALDMYTHADTCVLKPTCSLHEKSHMSISPHEISSTKALIHFCVAPRMLITALLLDGGCLFISHHNGTSGSGGYRQA
jgi:hypothetical protein